MVPTRPHPHAPDTRPGNAPVGLVSGVSDKAKDVVDLMTP